jgi:hypothetical protein
MTLRISDQMNLSVGNASHDARMSKAAWIRNAISVGLRLPFGKNDLQNKAGKKETEK